METCAGHSKGEPTVSTLVDLRLYLFSDTKGGTPDTAPSSPVSPLSSDTLSPAMKEMLYENVHDESIAMIEEFAKLYWDTERSLQDQKVSVMELVHRLEFWRGPKESDSDFRDTGLPELRRARNIHVSMSIIVKYCSFFSYSIVKYIINLFGTRKDKDNLAAYKKKFEKYAQCCVIDGSMKTIDEMSKEDFPKNMFMILDDSFDNCPQICLKMFIADVRKALNISSDVKLELCHVSRASD